MDEITTDEAIEKLKTIIDVLNFALNALEEKQTATKATNEKPIWYNKDCVDPRL